METKIEKKDIVKQIIKLLADRELFCVIYICACLLRSLSILTAFMDPLCGLCFIWGVILIIYDVFTKKELFMSNRWVLSVMFVFSYGLTIFAACFRGEGADLYIGIKNLVCIALSLLLFFLRSRKLSQADILLFLKKINSCVIGVSFFAGGISILLYFVQKEFEIFKGTGAYWIRVGYLENRSFGIYGEPEIGYIYALLSIMAVILNLLIDNKNFSYCSIFYKINLVIQVLYFSLELSNSGFDGNIMHNSYLQILVSSGIMGEAIFLCIILFSLLDICRFLKNKCKSLYGVRIVGFLFSICVLIMGNCMVESHLLFIQHDPVGFIFWSYLGIILALINKPDFNENQQGAVVICHTPFQILNALNLIISKQEELGKDNILYLSCEFAEAGEYAKRLRETGLFQEVIEVIPFKKYGGWKHKLVAIKRYVFPRYSLKKHLKTNLGKKLKENYKYLIFSVHTSLVSTFRLLYPDSENILIDDGIGSYLGNILIDHPSKLFKMLAKYFFNGALQIYPKALYLNSIEMSETTIDCEIYQLNTIKSSSNLLENIKFVFDYKESDEYSTHRLIFLDQPMEFKNKIRQNNYNELWSIVEKAGFGSQVMIRPHPRQEKKKYHYYQQNVNNLWELECINTIQNSHILMGIFSTAQFMPPILMGSEPVLIFLYRLLFDETSNDFKQFDNMVNRLKLLYKNSEKICIPESLETLETFLKQLS